MSAPADRPAAMPDLLPHGTDAAGRPLFIDRRGRYHKADGTPTGWFETRDEARRLWADHPRDEGEELADLVKALEADR